MKKGQRIHVATLPIFIAHFQGIRSKLGAHEKKVRRYPESPKTLGEHLRKRRLELLKTQAEAADVFGIGWPGYRLWEQDEVEPPVYHWPKIIAFLGYDPCPPKVTTFPEGLAALRRALGMDKKQFAAHLGVDLKSIHNWEFGKAKPFPAGWSRLARLAMTHDIELPAP